LTIYRSYVVEYFRRHTEGRWERQVDRRTDGTHIRAEINYAFGFDD